MILYRVRYEPQQFVTWMNESPWSLIPLLSLTFTLWTGKVRHLTCPSLRVKLMQSTCNLSPPPSPTPVCRPFPHLDFGPGQHEGALMSCFASFFIDVSRFSSSRWPSQPLYSSSFLSPTAFSPCSWCCVDYVESLLCSSLCTPPMCLFVVPRMFACYSTNQGPWPMRSGRCGCVHSLLWTQTYV